jgi:glycine dehydrogenase subunit 1
VAGPEDRGAPPGDASRAAYAAERLTRIPGVGLRFTDTPFFEEFALRLPRPAAEVCDRLVEHGFLAGVPMAEDERTLLVAVTERRTREEIDRFALALQEVVT